MTPNKLQILFSRPLPYIRKWAKKRGIKNTKLQGIYDHYFDRPKCSECNSFTNWSVGHKKYSEFCSQKCMNASPKTLERRRATCLERYGFEEAQHSPIVKAKKIKTFQRNYGVDNPSYVDDVKLKRVKTFNKKWGADHWTKVAPSLFEINNPMHNEVSKQKLRDTCMERYGVDNPYKAQFVKDKVAAINIKKYGVANPGHLALGYKRKVYWDRLGIKHIVQGYEPKAIEWLFEKQNVIRVISSSRKVPNIRYRLDGKVRTYHPDLLVYTDKEKRLIEVKSTHTIRCNLETNQAKFEAAQRYMKKRNGTFWVLLVMDNGTIKKFNDTSVIDIIKQAGLSIPNKSKR